MEKKYKIYKILNDAKEFNNIIKKNSNWSVYQTWGWGEVRRTLGFPNHRFLLKHGDTISYGFSAQEVNFGFGLKFLLIQGAPIWKSNFSRKLKEFSAVLKDLANEYGAVFVALEPYLLNNMSEYDISDKIFIDSGFRRGTIYQRHTQTLIIDLQPCEEEIFFFYEKDT